MINGPLLSLRLQLHLPLPLPTLYPAGLPHRWKFGNRPGRFLCRLHRDRHERGEEKSYNYNVCTDRSAVFLFFLRARFKDWTVQTSKNYCFMKYSNPILPLFILCRRAAQSRWRLKDCPLLWTVCHMSSKILALLPRPFQGIYTEINLGKSWGEGAT